MLEAQFFTVFASILFLKFNYLETWVYVLFCLTLLIPLCLILCGVVQVKVLCHLHHDQLKAVFHVSQRIRMGVSPCLLPFFLVYWCFPLLIFLYPFLCFKAVLLYWFLCGYNCGRSFLLDSFTLIIPLQIDLARKCWVQWLHLQQNTGHSLGLFAEIINYKLSINQCSNPKTLFVHCSKGERRGFRLASPHTPKAPRHGPRPPSRLKYTEMRQVAAALFQEASLPSRCMVPSVLSKPLCKNRVLFYEDELCQAVAQNKLRWFDACLCIVCLQFLRGRLVPFVYFC